MCNCNAIVVVLLTPCSQMDYEIVVAVGQVRKVFNPPKKKSSPKGVPEKQSFRFTLIACPRGIS